MYVTCTNSKRMCTTWVNVLYTNTYTNANRHVYPPTVMLKRQDYPSGVLMIMYFHLQLRPKRAAPENLAPEQECKHQRASGASTSEPPP